MKFNYYVLNLIHSFCLTFPPTHIPFKITLPYTFLEILLPLTPLVKLHPISHFSFPFHTSTHYLCPSLSPVIGHSSSPVAASVSLSGFYSGHLRQSLSWASCSSLLLAAHVSIFFHVRVSSF